MKAVADTAFDVIIVNFANADMVGHSGKMEPTIRGGGDGGSRAWADLSGGEAAGGSLLVTADHGNAEMLIDPATGGPHTAHTTNPVPFILVTDAGEKVGVRLADAAGYLADDAGVAGYGAAEGYDGNSAAGIDKRADSLTAGELP